jgi:hypothetical protein
VQNNRGLKENGVKKKPHFFDEPRWIVFGEKNIVFLNPPCYETPKNAIKKINKKQLKNEVSHFFFSRPPLQNGHLPGVKNHL